MKILEIIGDFVKTDTEQYLKDRGDGNYDHPNGETYHEIIEVSWFDENGEPAEFKGTGELVEGEI